MTIDSVVQKTAIALGVVILTAAATWIMTPDLKDSEASLGPLFAALTIGSLGAFALSMVNSFKRVISPALVLAFCVFEGVALGAFSKVIDSIYSTPDTGNLVVQAVIGTFAAFAGTLAAYKVFDIKVGHEVPHVRDGRGLRHDRPQPHGAGPQPVQRLVRPVRLRRPRRGHRDRSAWSSVCSC